MFLAPFLIVLSLQSLGWAMAAALALAAVSVGLLADISTIVLVRKE